MHPRKEQYAKEIYMILDQYCEKYSETKDTSHNALSLVLGISNAETQTLINKILIALPDKFFYMANPDQLHDMLGFIAQQYLLFQVQEDIKDELFPILLINFINCLVEDIMVRYHEHV